MMNEDQTCVDLLIEEIEALYEVAENTPARITLAKILEVLEQMSKDVCFKDVVNAISSLITPFAYPSFESGIFDFVIKDVTERAKKYFHVSGGNSDD